MGDTNGHSDAAIVYVDGVIYQRLYSAELKPCHNILFNHGAHAWGERGKTYWCVGVHDANK